MTRLTYKTPHAHPYTPTYMCILLHKVKFFLCNTGCIAIHISYVKSLHAFFLLRLSLLSKVKTVESCLTLCTPDPMVYTVHGMFQARILELVLVTALCNSTGYSPPGSSVHGILQARILEWIAIPFSRVSS